jgi:hypothetical protein
MSRLKAIAQVTGFKRRGIAFSPCSIGGRLEISGKKQSLRG